MGTRMDRKPGKILQIGIAADNAERSENDARRKRMADMRVLDNLNGAEGSYILPFFWQHGESAAVLREYMNCIYNANIREVCLEARPHPDFAGETWFRDFDIIMDEAKKLGMKIWILDDAHFPSGQAAGRMAEQPDRLQKTYLNYNIVDITGPVKQVTTDIETMAHYYKNPFKGGSHPFVQPDEREYTDPERLIAVVAGRLDGKFGDMYHMDELIDLTDQVENGRLIWDVPEGSYRLFVIYETHKGGGRGGSVNFLSRESCRVQIDNCYEPHRARYEEEFGKTILGFFSDEPEVGNVLSYSADAGRIGNPDMPLPWSEEMPALMEARFGADYRTKIPALWNTAKSDAFTADVRVGYMDIVSNLCRKNFGEQMGEWCRRHNLKYIGHIVEDCDASPNLAASQGHFFRALWGQDWSGVDNIGGQITIGGANRSHLAFTGTAADGEFYHHELGKLGTSLADIDPKKHGVTMCETFGAYGWDEGTRLMKYEVDHLLARGINRYVPHAFSPKEFPDSDCPPHFYAHGKNPLYKPFGTLMKYTNRLCHLIDGGSHAVNAAVLYHAEAEWSGQAYIEMGKAARFLDDAQIDFDFIPADVFRTPAEFDSFVDEEGLHINGHVFSALVVPGLSYVTDETLAFIKANDGRVRILFAERVPDKLAGAYEPVSLEEIPGELAGASLKKVSLTPENPEIQVYHYCQEKEDYLLINNEGVSGSYRGTVCFSDLGDAAAVFGYDAFSNRLSPVSSRVTGEGLAVDVDIHAFEMLVLVVPKGERELKALREKAVEIRRFSEEISAEIDGAWRVSFCLNENYPEFADEIRLEELQNINLFKENWSGVIRYENTFELKERAGSCQICAEDAWESLELWVNGAYAGERICPPYRFDVSELIREGQNEIRFECRTNLERLVHGITGGRSFFGPEFAAVKPSGIVGTVTVHTQTL